MHFDLSAEQRAMRDTIREICDAHAGSARARRYGAGEDEGRALWSALGRAGWSGIAVSEQHGGQGLGTVELAIACEEMGRSLAPAMLLGTAAAALLLEHAGDERQRSRWLRPLATGETRAALGNLREDGGGLALDVDGAELVVLARGGRALLARVPPSSLQPVSGIDVTRRLHRVEPREQEALAGEALEGALDRVEVAIAAELVGVAQRALDLAVEHALTRQQFGRPIGAYQAVSHRCADMLLEVESARSAVLFAAWTADHDDANLPLAASVAKVAAAQGAWQVAASSLQVHGGIGFTWEHDCHLLLRRAAATARLLGSMEWHLERVAALRGLGARPRGEDGMIAQANVAVTAVSARLS